MSFVLSKQIVETGTVGAADPEKLSSWALGPYLRVAGYPFAFGGFQPGLYLDFTGVFCRGSTTTFTSGRTRFRQLGILSGGLSFRF